jgi:hypothetical protein
VSLSSAHVVSHPHGVPATVTHDSMESTATIFEEEAKIPKGQLIGPKITESIFCRARLALNR